VNTAQFARCLYSSRLGFILARATGFTERSGQACAKSDFARRDRDQMLELPVAELSQWEDEGWMERRRISTENAPKALGPYSQAIVANGFVFCSGTVGINPDTGLLAEGVAEQTEQAGRRLISSLKRRSSTQTSRISPISTRSMRVTCPILRQLGQLPPMLPCPTGFLSRLKQSPPWRTGADLFRACRRQQAELGFGGPPGSRSRHLGIKSPLLFRMS
jgi:hypothetical protein